MLRKLIWIVLLMFLASVQSEALTIVRGNVQGVWREAGSPFIAQANITVPAGQSLRIEPGVRVQFDPTYRLVVNGLLTAVGTEEDSIVFTWNREGSRWRGIRMMNAHDDSEISWCIIEWAETVGEFDNVEARGAGLFLEGCDALISHNTVRRNNTSGRTAGIHAQNCDPIIIYNLVTLNTGFTAGSLLVDNSRGLVAYNRVVENRTLDAGGISAYRGAPRVENNIIMFNHTQRQFWGSGLYICWDCTGSFRNNLIANNDGGGLYVGASSNVQDFTNNTIVNNPGRCGILVYQSRLRLTNCIVWNHADPIWLHDRSAASASYTDMQAFANEGMQLGEGMLDVNPLFIDEENFDYRLQLDSPCRDAGDPNSPRDPDGSRADIGCYLGSPFDLTFDPDSIDFGRVGQDMDFIRDLTITWVVDEDPGEELWIFIAALEEQQDWLGVIPSEEDLTANEPAVFQVVANIPENAELGHREGVIEVFIQDNEQPAYILPVQAEVFGEAPENRHIALRRGWNLISTNVNPPRPNIRSLMLPLVRAGRLEILKDDQGRFYYPDNNFCNIPRWEYSQGYLLKLNAPAEFTFAGLVIPADQPLSLREGWQMVSYFPRVAAAAPIALSGIREVLEIAKDGAGNFYLPRYNFSNMPDLTEGQGYLLKVVEDVELIWQVD